MTLATVAADLGTLFNAPAAPVAMRASVFVRLADAGLSVAESDALWSIYGTGTLCIARNGDGWVIRSVATLRHALDTLGDDAEAAMRWNPAAMDELRIIADAADSLLCRISVL